MQKACQKKEIQPFPGALFLHKGKRWCRIIAQTVEKRGRKEMADSNSTKSALADAMKKLMVCKSFAKISISDLCEECGLNRKSFYYHFKDIYDLLEWIFANEVVKKIEKETIDITLPSTKIQRGSKHPVNRVIEEIEDLFVSMGYDVISGPELETDEFCFERLNLPKGHPARDMQDSFYITNEYLLRTQTSAVQARTMLANTEKTPIRMICAGKTYRREDDATHSHQFGQVEGLVIDKKERHVSLADLKGTLEIFVKKLIGKNCELRFRPSYFPFTEPSYEVDVSCFKCGGKGCRMCKGSGWIEILGCGMVHPHVLEMCGIDPEVYSGFAFGIGVTG